MSKQNIYALRDVKTEAFHRPFFLQNRAVLDRSVRDAVQDENSTLSVHPEDYQVYALGTFDEASGVIEATPPEFLFNVNELKEIE